MNKDFDPENSHQENVKVAIDKIIGQATNIKKRKKTEQEQKKVLFKSIIDHVIESEQKVSLLHEMFSIDLSSYTNIFYDIIDEFFKYSFSKEQIKIINFYLYDRYSPDGSILQLKDENDNIINLDTPEDLWYFIKSMENVPK